MSDGIAFVTGLAQTPVSSAAINTALGYTPMANTSSAVTTALGYTPIAGANVMQALFVLRNADLTLTSDQAFTKLFTGTKYAVTSAYAIQKTGAFGVAALGGVYTAASKGGTPIIAAAQSYAALTGTLTSALPVIAVLSVQNATPLILSMSTGNTGALTADFFIFGVILD